MQEPLLADDIVARIQTLRSRFHERAYLFVLAALEYGQQQREVRGHVSGQELSWACRDFAMEQFGLTARSVLEYWGVTSTDDIGQIVYDLIEIGLFMKQESDSIEDFAKVFDFGTAFEGDYPWAGVRHAPT